MFNIFCKRSRIINPLLNEACLRATNNFIKKAIANYDEKKNIKKLNVQPLAIMNSPEDNNNTPDMLFFFGIVSAVYIFYVFLQ
jgi:hypothetical protein